MKMVFLIIPVILTLISVLSRPNYAASLKKDQTKSSTSDTAICNDCKKSEIGNNALVKVSEEINKVVFDKWRALSYFAVTEDEFLSAPCRQSKPQSGTERLAWLENNYINNVHDNGSELINEEVNGIQFIQQPRALVRLVSKLTTVADNAKDTEQKIFNIPGCNKFTCAIEGVFGKGRGISMAYALAKFGFNLSWIRGKAFKTPQYFTAFTNEEVEDFLLTFADIPEEFVSKISNRNRSIVRSTEDSGGIYADAGGHYFNNWSKSPAWKRKMTIYHEFGHDFAQYNDSKDLSQDWVDASGWIAEKETWTSKTSGVTYETKKYRTTNPLSTFVSPYAKENILEDFAETFTAYRYSPYWLKHRSPKRYEYMKTKIYNGKEYLDQKDCH